MATAPDELTFEEASAPAAEAPDEISFEEGHGIDPKALQAGIQASIGATKAAASVAPFLREGAEPARQANLQEKLQSALRTAVTVPTGAIQTVRGVIENPLIGRMSEGAREYAQRQRERQAVQQMGRVGLDPSAMAGVLPDETQGAVAKVGRAMQTAGRFLYGGLADIGMDITGQSIAKPGETAPLGNIEAALTGQPMPAETARKTLGPVLGGTLAASQGLISTAPQMVAVAGLQAAGIPAPLAAAVIFGTTPEGFDPKQAAIAAALPFVGKYTGEVTAALAKKLGVSTTRAQNIFRGLGGTAGAAAYMATIQESEIAKLPPEQQKQARIDAVANIMSQVALGPMGVEFRGTTPAEMAGIALSREIKRTTPPGTPRRFLVEGAEPERPLTTVTTATGEKIQVPKSTEAPPPTETELERAERESKEAKAEEGVMIGERVKAGKIKPENVVVTINPAMKMGEKTIPGFVQVDEVHPTEGNVWSNKAETLRKYGFGIPSTEELLKLPMGQYKLTQIREMIKGAKPAEAPAAAPEKITAAAYRTEEGKVETGANHPEILKRLGVAGFETAESRNTPQFGFVTDKGRFITREEAGPISKASGQALKDFEPGEPVHSDEVASPVKPTTPISEVPKLSEDQVRDLVSQASAIVKTRKLAPADRRALGVEMENARAGAPERLQELVKRLSGAEPKVAPTIKGGPQGRFNAETEQHGYDLLAWINEHIKLLSKSGAKKAGRYALNSGDWDDAPSKLSAPHHGVIYSEVGYNPTDVAQKAFEAGKLKDPSASALWQAIKAASAKRAGAAGGAGREGKIIAEAGPQLERWQAAATQPSEGHPIELTTEELKPGDTIKVAGETLRVSARDPDNGDITLVDGDKFGTQTLMEGEKIYAAEHVQSPTTERPGDVFSRVDEHPGGEAGAAIQAHGTPTGLPPSVPGGGPHFASELMAAAQRLGTIIRTRATLRPGVLGQYVRRRAGVTFSDKIEVGELKNQFTMSHEMGHDLDQLLWPGVDLGYPMKTLAERAGVAGTGKNFHTELMAVSELMRGPFAGSKAYVNYRKRAAELIADHFALYAHDPARARALAPQWTKVLEDQLARNANAQETIRQLHAGNVTPVPGIKTTPPIGTAAGMPGKVPPVIPPVAVSPDAGLFNTAASAVKGLWRKFKSEVIRAQVRADEWRKMVPQLMDRYDVGGFVEGTGNLEIPGDTIAALQARMTPAKYEMVKRYKYSIEQVRGEINQYLKGMTQGEYLDFIKDYLPHFYDIKSPKGQSALGRFLKNSPNAKQRKIPTLQEAVEAGLTPISQDPAVLYEMHARINWRVATNRMLVGQLGKMRTSGGEKVLVPWGEAPPGYIRSDNPLIQRVYAMQGKGGTMLWRGGAGIHPDAWTAVRQMLEMPTNSNLAKAYDSLNSVTRANAFAFSFFHDMTLRFASTGAQWRWYNPARGMFRMFEKNPLTGELELFRSTAGLGKELLQHEEIAVDAARHGLVFSFNDSESYQMQARDFLDRQATRWKDNPILGTATRLARDLQHWRQKGLWKNTHDAYKIMAYQDMTAKALADAPAGTNPSVVKEQVASLLNDAFGGQEWQTKFWLSPQNRRMLARFFLAPDWTFSTLRSVPLISDAASITRGNLPRIAGKEPIPTMQEGLGGNLGRLRFWGSELAAIATATVAAQYAIYQAFGDKSKGDKAWIWENEEGQSRRIDVTPIMRKLPWKSPNDPTRYYVNLGKRPEEVLGYFTHADQNLMSKAARPVAEVMRQVTGTEGDFKAQWKRDHETFLESLPERTVKAGGQLLPFVFSGNQFALSVPYRKGMTKYKAQQAYESTYELAANPGYFPSARAFLRGVPAPDGTLTEMVASITDAAERNGVPSEEIRKRALSTIRGKYYDQFFKASKALDVNYSRSSEKALEAAAQALENLGATGSQISRSLKRRTALEPYSE